MTIKKTLLLSLVLIFSCIEALSENLETSYQINNKKELFHDCISLLNNDAKNSKALLKYFRNRDAIIIPNFDEKQTNNSDEQRWADEALEHKFYVHAGYQPSYFYGEDIDWEYWPIKDNELRWQIHRMKWWLPLGRAFHKSKNEKYAKEWTYEYLDWIRKNPLGDYRDEDAKKFLTADNMYFAWRPLEVSDRLEEQIKQFILFLPSKHFTGDFLCEFLINYHKHCEHMIKHLSKSGNHLLFQAQRLLYASIFFPEFKDSKKWQEIAIKILNKEIGKQVYNDGIQYELDPHYHLESTMIFFKALEICDANGMKEVFPNSYVNTVHKMIIAIYNYSYPNMDNPMFSDFHGQHDMLPLYKMWAKVFTEDAMIQYLASEGKTGHVPTYLSKAFPTSGFYCMRNGWDMNSTILIMKAGPQGFWHCQPDNGTFEYWRKGRNFFPDSGCYVYGGDEEILKMRAWFRRTASHNTFTFNYKDLEYPVSELISWSASGSKEMIRGEKSKDNHEKDNLKKDNYESCVTIRTKGYDGICHERTILFEKSGKAIIKDKITGDAEGFVAIHYQLTDEENNLSENYEIGSQYKINSKNKPSAQNWNIKTNFDDGNNISLSVYSNDAQIVMKKTLGRVSYKYRHYNVRPSYEFSTYKKSGQEINFITIIQPCK